MYAEQSKWRDYLGGYGFLSNFVHRNMMIEEDKRNEDYMIWFLCLMAKEAMLFI